MRTLDRPSENILNDYGGAILQECAFFGIDTGLPEVIQGSLAPAFYMRYIDRRINGDEDACHTNPFAHYHGLLLDVHKEADTQLRPREHLQQPLLLAKDPRPAVHGDYSEFYRRMSILSDGLIDELRGIKNIVIAGGSVLAALYDTPHTKMTSLSWSRQKSARQAFARILQLCETPHEKDSRNTLLDNSFPQYDNILHFFFARRRSTCPNDIPRPNFLYGFSADSSSFALSPAERRAWCSLRGQRAVQHSANLAGSARAGTSRSHTARQFKPCGRRRLHRISSA